MKQLDLLNIPNYGVFTTEYPQYTLEAVKAYLKTENIDFVESNDQYKLEFDVKRDNG